MSNGVTADIQEIFYRWWNGAAEPAPSETDFAATVQLLIGVVGADPADPFDLIVCSPSRLAKYYRGEAWDGYEVLPGGTVLPITGVWRMKSWSRVDFEAALQRVPTKRCGSGPIRRGLCGAGGPAGGCDRQSDEQEGHNNRPHSRREACETPQAG